jgi:hypothetical protein
MDEGGRDTVMPGGGRRDRVRLIPTGLALVAAGLSARSVRSWARRPARTAPCRRTDDHDRHDRHDEPAVPRRLLTTEGVRDVGVLALLTVLGGGAAFSAVETDQDLTTWDGSGGR